MIIYGGQDDKRKSLNDTICLDLENYEWFKPSMTSASENPGSLSHFSLTPVYKKDAINNTAKTIYEVEAGTSENFLRGHSGIYLIGGIEKGDIINESVWRLSITKNSVSGPRFKWEKC